MSTGAPAAEIEVWRGGGKNRGHGEASTQTWAAAAHMVTGNKLRGLSMDVNLPFFLLANYRDKRHCVQDRDQGENT